MSQAIAKHHAAVYETEYDEVNHESSWTGWVGFAGFMMILSSVIHIINGIVGLYREGFYAVSNGSDQLLIIQNVSDWGWVNLFAGIVVILAGLSLFSGSMWSRILAIVMLMGVVAVNVVSIALFPLWSLLAITFAVLSMYAIIVHGGELKHQN